MQFVKLKCQNEINYAEQKLLISDILCQMRRKKIFYAEDKDHKWANKAAIK